MQLQPVHYVLPGHAHSELHCLAHLLVCASPMQLRAGVPLACVTVTYNLLDVAAAPLLQLCQARGIKVFAGAALAHGLISEAFVGVAQPSTAAVPATGNNKAVDGAATGGGPGSRAAEALGPDNLAAGLSMVAKCVLSECCCAWSTVRPCKASWADSEWQPQ